jgi:hypothetical protein
MVSYSLALFHSSSMDLLILPIFMLIGENDLLFRYYVAQLLSHSYLISFPIMCSFELFPFIEFRSRSF